MCAVYRYCQIWNVTCLNSCDALYTSALAELLVWLVSKIRSIESSAVIGKEKGEWALRALTGDVKVNAAGPIRWLRSVVNGLSHPIYMYRQRRRVPQERHRSFRFKDFSVYRRNWEAGRDGSEEKDIERIRRAADRQTNRNDCQRERENWAQARIIMRKNSNYYFLVGTNISKGMCDVPQPDDSG